MRKTLSIPNQGFNIEDKNSSECRSALAQFIAPGHSETYNKDADVVTYNTSTGKIELFLKQAQADKKFIRNGDYTGNFINSIVEEYIIFNNILMDDYFMGKDGSFVGFVTNKHFLKDVFPEEYDGTVDEVQLTFSVDATKEEMINYINNHWADIEKIKQEIVGIDKQKRNKLSKNFIRDIKIYNRYQEILGVPSKMRGSKYPDLILSKEFNIDNGSIRAIVHKIDQSLRVANAECYE